MRELKNFVAVDWRAGKDKIFFFFKDSNTYSRFDIGDNRVPDGYPTQIGHDSWHDFHAHAKNVRFGFTTTSLAEEDTFSADQDFLWLFYIDGITPMVCKYNQDTDKVISTRPVIDTVWHPILPYFYRIVAGTWWQASDSPAALFRFLLNDGNSFYFDWDVSLQRPVNLDFNKDRTPKVTVEPIDNSTWPGLEPYKDRIITAVQNDRTFADSYYYIFLTNNEYITYNIVQNRVEYGPYQVSEKTWPGLLHG
ncbi:hypothetical protein [Pseudomonas nunensis]|uniref:hypothetical protein n=1 Tax=Pseudomonas nunensis TaxID=2961896 RepID=UPI0025AF6744|nr:hypothetical protein [Pseudomonas nunensis]MDN3220385.1 hypothetical protein [Pseudomonas nunensis]